MAKKWKRVIVSTEIRLVTKDGDTFYTPVATLTYESIAPYRELGDEVVVVARTTATGDVNAMSRITGPGVTVRALSEYRGLAGLLRKSSAIARELRRVGGAGDLFVVRLPEPLSFALALRSLAARGRLLCNLVADPVQLGRQFAPGPLGRVIGHGQSVVVRALLRQAAAVVFVTQRYFQDRYRVRSNTPTLARSNVLLSAESFRWREPGESQGIARVISVGSMSNHVKGFDVLLKALQLVRENGRPIELVLVGGGPLEDSLKKLAFELRVTDSVRFTGHVSDGAVLRQLLDSSDLYVSASRTEGLPRAVIEAMARSLPVIGTNAGGTSELLREDLVVAVDSPESIANKIVWLLDNPDVRHAAARENYETARAVAQNTAPDRYREFLRTIE